MSNANGQYDVETFAIFFTKAIKHDSTVAGVRGHFGESLVG